MRRALSLIVLTLSIFLGLAGCEKQRGLAPLKRRPHNYQKIVSLSPGTTEILAGALTVQIIGRTEADNYPTQVTSIPVVASVKPDYEKIASLGPDLIVYDGALYSQQDIDKLKSTGAAVFKLNANNLEDFKNQIYELSSLLGQEITGSGYVDRIMVEFNAGQGAVPKPGPKVAVIMASASGNHYIDGTDSFNDNLIKSLGGTPVGPKGTDFAPLSPEAMTSFDPDVIVADGTKADTKGVEALLKDPRFASLKAIKNKKVRVIDRDVLLRRGSRVDSLIKGLARAMAN